MSFLNKPDEWISVPLQVKSLVKEGSVIFNRLRAVMKTLPSRQHGYGHVWFNPRTQVVFFSHAKADSDMLVQDWVDGLRVKGIKRVVSESKELPDKAKGPWILVKQAEIQNILGPVAQLGGWKEGYPAKLFGGPSPLSAMIASGVLGAGAGYGAGWLAEKLMPEKYFEKGKLRRALGLAGGLVGAAPGAWAATTNWQNNSGITDPIGQYKASSVNYLNNLNSVLDILLQPDNFQSLETQKFAQNLDNFVINALDRSQSSLPGAGSPYVKSIEKDRFNRALWNDPYTPDAIKGMTSGVVEGAAQLSQSSLVSPIDIARIGISMGSGYASSLLAGKTLSALAGLNTAGQEALQRVGTWAGIVKGVAPLLFSKPVASEFNEFYG